MQRRELLKAMSLPLATAAIGGAWSGWASAAAAGSAFGADTVPAMARALAAKPYRPANADLPEALARIKYDTWRDIRFDPAQALWKSERLPFQLQFFHRAFLFKQRVDMHVVDGGVATPVVYAPSMFSFGKAPRPAQNDLGFAGFRVHAPINRADYFDEVCAFLGASYFRAVAKDLLYGLSARALALNTGAAGDEEFPAFTGFWIERPAAGAKRIVVHALFDSPSVAGAVRFAITPGSETVFDTQLRLYPRVSLPRAGIAPLTSMYHFDATDRVGIDDFRPAVHDSDGLAVHNGAGEQLWRPLNNPAALQESAFQDRTPRAFGLMQRKRAFADYADSEAHYERRPSAWVEPIGDWGEGAVHLLEIPTRDEYNDNIVAFWRPRAALAPGREHRFDYRLHWCAKHSWRAALATVARTRIGAGGDGARLVVIDLEGGGLGALPKQAQPRAVVWASAGQVANAVAHPNPGTGGWRLSFELRPGDARAVELRAVLEDGDGPLSETWLYRWTE
ncbi:glucan biosynthesis protein [Pseudomonas sp. CGJS7]|uniref:glucan biosynthesis protein n=1 Tax=Pseudomonas sp. CGJS7 TaxID=3109348 RepID=UPI0030081BBD